MATAVKIGRRGGALALLHRFVPYTHTPDDQALSSHPRTQVLDIVAAVVALCATLAYAAFTFRYLTSRPPIQEFSTFNADELAERVAVVGGRSLHLRDLAVDLGDPEAEAGPPIIIGDTVDFLVQRQLDVGREQVLHTRLGDVMVPVEEDLEFR